MVNEDNFWCCMEKQLLCTNEMRWNFLWKFELDDSTWRLEWIATTKDSLIIYLIKLFIYFQSPPSRPPLFCAAVACCTHVFCSDFSFWFLLFFFNLILCYFTFNFSIFILWLVIQCSFCCSSMDIKLWIEWPGVEYEEMKDLNREVGFTIKYVLIFSMHITDINVLETVMMTTKQKLIQSRYEMRCKENFFILMNHSIALKYSMLSFMFLFYAEKRFKMSEFFFVYYSFSHIYWRFFTFLYLSSGQSHSLKIVVFLTFISRDQFELNFEYRTNL